MNAGAGMVKQFLCQLVALVCYSIYNPCDVVDEDRTGC
jgi:hypothetical protein